MVGQTDFMEIIEVAACSTLVPTDAACKLNLDLNVDPSCRLQTFLVLRMDYAPGKTIV